MTRPPLANQRHLFEIPDDLVYLNCASQAPQLHSVRLAGERALARSATPWTIGDKDWFDEVEELRELFSRLIGADPLAGVDLGGDGVTSEFPVMRHLANLESVRNYEGTDEIHQLVIGRALTGLNAF